MRPPACLPPVLALTVLAATPLAAAEDSDIAELKAMVGAMQKTITDQNARIAQLERQQKAASAPKAAKRSSSAGSSAAGAAVTETAVPEVSTASLPMQRAAAMRDADTFEDLQKAAPRIDNAPLDPELKGFIMIPGTETMFKIGGSARVDTIVDLENNGNPNQFVPSSIPVPGEDGWDGGERTTMHTKGTRINLELRRPVAFNDTLRVFSEYDFFDDSASSSMKFRTRHFYGQAWNFLIGQTYSAFMDIDAFPDVVDYQGPNGIVNRRQPQIRYTQPLWEGDTEGQLFFSVEQPESQIDTNTDEFTVESDVVSRVPDGILGFRLEGERGHLQTAAIFRQLSFESDEGPDEDVFGWGVNLSGSLNVGDKDKFSAQVTYGEGISRYINDLSGENLDAAVQDGHLDAVPVFAAMAGYTHHWNECWRSTVSAGYVHADSPDVLGPFAVSDTVYGSANLMWHPTKSFRTGLEYLYGSKDTIGGSDRDAHRLNFVIRYDLVR